MAWPDPEWRLNKTMGTLRSGIARGLRDAAWQFRVRPPRVGGKPMIGAWVRILITFGKDGDPMVRSGRR